MQCTYSAWGKESRDGAFRRVEDMDLNDVDHIIFHETFSNDGQQCMVKIQFLDIVKYTLEGSELR